MSQTIPQDQGIVEADFDVERKGPVAVLKLSGTLTGEGHQHLSDLLDWLIAQGANEVTIELGSTNGVDSACISLLRVVHTRLRKRRGRLLVSSSLPTVSTALMHCGIASAQAARRTGTKSDHPVADTARDPTRCADTIRAEHWTETSYQMDSSAMRETARYVPPSSHGLPRLRGLGTPR